MLRGMFAFAIWDARDGSCFLARDPFGIKPLYHASDSHVGGLIFASELRALLATGLVPRRIDAGGAQRLSRHRLRARNRAPWSRA